MLTLKNLFNIKTKPSSDMVFTSNKDYSLYVNMEAQVFSIVFPSCLTDDAELYLRKTAADLREKHGMDIESNLHLAIKASRKHFGSHDPDDLWHGVYPFFWE